MNPIVIKSGIYEVTVSLLRNSVRCDGSARYLVAPNFGSSTRVYKKLSNALNKANELIESRTKLMAPMSLTSR